MDFFEKIESNESLLNHHASPLKMNKNRFIPSPLFIYCTASINTFKMKNTIFT